MVQTALAVPGKSAHLRRASGEDTATTQHSNTAMPSNVLGQPLQACCYAPTTGFYRDGFCRTGPDDKGLHTVCIVATAEFLAFSRDQGNDLSTPMPQFDFPGLKPGDQWCLCVTRWVDAFQAGKAPSVVLEATHLHALEFIALEDLQANAAK